ncbi:MAG TPA: lytic murein transglycosylase [Propionibacteriaceae bacterium]|nr:lytic murein transglycosylase [Propionibacteriaceae bacterium]
MIGTDNGAGGDERRQRVDPVAAMLVVLSVIVAAVVVWWVWPRQVTLSVPQPSPAVTSTPAAILTPALPNPTISGALGVPPPASTTAPSPPASTTAPSPSRPTPTASRSSASATSRAPTPSMNPSQENPVVVDPEWLASTSAKAGLTAEAMRAYAAAELRLTVEKPGCHVAWNTLAGVGWVESQNGTFAGHWVKANGDLDSPIIGPALDGTRFASIPDTDGGEFDGDTVWDRAVGPMQFLPGTWNAWGRDGSGDGVANPQNLDDAALAAASYLCANGGDLTTPAGWTNAVFSYNRSEDYVTTVLEAAEVYAERSWR